MGSCFYDSVIFCLKRSKWNHIVDKYVNGLALRNASLNWTFNLRNENQELYYKFCELYLEIINIITFDNSGGQDGSDAFIIGCNTLDEHINRMLACPAEYCRNIDISIISTFLNIDINIFTRLNGNLTRKANTTPLDKYDIVDEKRPYVTLYLGNNHYIPIMDVKDKYENSEETIIIEHLKLNNTEKDSMCIQDDSSELSNNGVTWNITSLTQFDISQEDEEMTQSFFDLEEPQNIICSYQGDSLSQESFDRLKPGVWLNDEVINFYSKMIIKEQQNKGERIHLFRSHFMTQLSSKSGISYKNVERWSRNVHGGDLFDLSKLFIPINVNRSHWILAVIFFEEKRIQIYDSMNGSGYRYLNMLFDYLKCEFRDKKKSKGSWNDWKLIPCGRNTPQQENGFDCGVFVCMYIHYIADNRELNFTQEDINNYRKFIAYQIAMLRS